MSLAEIDRLTTVLDVLVSPLLMEMLGLVGAVASATIRLIESAALEDTLPAASFTHRKTILKIEPSAPKDDKVKLTVLDRLLVAVMSAQSVDDELGAVEVSEA